MNLPEENEKLIKEIKNRAQKYVAYNIKYPRPSDFLLIENAMLVGASIQLEILVDKSE